MLNTSERLCTRASYKIFHRDSCVKGSWDFWLADLARKLLFLGIFFLDKMFRFWCWKNWTFLPPSRISNQLFICTSPHTVWGILARSPHLSTAESNAPRCNARADTPHWIWTCTPCLRSLGFQGVGADQTWVTSPTPFTHSSCTQCSSKETQEDGEGRRPPHVPPWPRGPEDRGHRACHRTCLCHSGHAIQGQIFWSHLILLDCVFQLS